MSLILTRRPGEAIIVTGGGLPPRRIYIVSIEGNVVRLAIDAPDSVRIIREELLPEEARRRWWEDTNGTMGRLAAMLCTTFALDRVMVLFL